MFSVEREGRETVQHYTGGAVEYGVGWRPVAADSSIALAVPYAMTDGLTGLK